MAHIFFMGSKTWFSFLWVGSGTCFFLSFFLRVKFRTKFFLAPIRNSALPLSSIELMTTFYIVEKEEEEAFCLCNLMLVPCNE